ncbi:Fe-S oxidoreductase [Microlunatus endophyticus]|uniref:Fe-S oxidoreductase n=1 Tax=Microlunatus endophyticus TaxID=1716077 RepID=A0A917S5P1_9ACTN|nr:(Fe-S)-binding protein [Microlunatus endophyticus]GGL56818.1 Fe-S oxidoreductase [Microlunatus endophyticus]
MKVSIFVTCLADTLFPDVGRATVTVLERLGCEVDFPTAQTCCGQMHMNTGYARPAGEMVRSFAETFAGAEAVVVPSGSCTGMLRVYGQDVAPGVHLPPVYELSEFLIDVLGVTDVGAKFDASVTYHPTCHSLRLLGVGDRPYRLLEAVEGLELKELPEAEQCCGFGGTFALKNAEVSSAMGEDKIDNALSTGAEVLVVSDSSCMMHLGGLLGRRKSSVRSMHLAEILAAGD